MNKTIKQIVIAVVLIALFSHNQASAGLFSWNKSSRNDTALANSLYVGTNFSLDNVLGNDDDTKDLLTIQTNSIMELPRISQTAVKAAKAKRVYTVSVSAYSSTPDQTDDSPFITARGTYVRDGIVAANFLPFGTAIKIPAMYGNKIFIVEDRMAKRFSQNVDIWFGDRESAIQFGRRTLTIEVVSL